MRNIIYYTLFIIYVIMSKNGGMNNEYINSIIHFNLNI